LSGPHTLPTIRRRIAERGQQGGATSPVVPAQGAADARRRREQGNLFMGLKRAWPAGALAAFALAPVLAHAAPEQLKGSRFIEAMQDNTLSGTTADGAAYNLYFLPGGEVSYDDSTGARDRGRWWMDPDGDVCVTFTEVDDGRAGCYRVEIDGRTVTWQGKAGGQGMLRGGVAESFLASP
jgi:hypothetical protein